MDLAPSGMASLQVASLLDILVEHHELLVAPPYIDETFIVWTGAAQDDYGFACGYHDGDSVLPIDRPYAERFRDQLKALAGKH
jgi:hypothetical protein